MGLKGNITFNKTGVVKYSIKTTDYGYSISALDELNYFVLDR